LSDSLRRILAQNGRRKSGGRWPAVVKAKLRDAKGSKDVKDKESAGIADFFVLVVLAVLAEAAGLFQRLFESL
jgi:hypothetical protein